MGKSEPKIVLLDIESLPDLKAVMSVMPQLSAYPGLTLKASINSVICFGYKVLGESKVRVVNAWDDSKAWAKDVNDDRYVLSRVAEILEDADCVVTHNGKRFDWKFLQTRLIKHGMTPLRRIIHIDTCQESKRSLLMFNNRLNTLAKFMTSEEKLENGGWELWERVLAREEKAMALMSRYCAQDIVTLEAVFKRLRPFMISIPNYNIVRAGKEFVCPRCASTRIQKRGSYASRSYRAIKIYCRDCDGWSSARCESKEPKAI